MHFFILCYGRDGSGILCELCPVGSTWNSETNSCQTNQCQCRNGIPSSGDACEFNRSKSCSDCDFGYHLIDSAIKNGTESVQVCRKNECSCSDGYSGVGSDCPEHNQEWCLDCIKSYQKVYSGSRVTCEPCQNGEYFDDTVGVCMLNKCVCNSIGIRGEESSLRTRGQKSDKFDFGHIKIDFKI